jgi:hypothetical protein
MKTLYLILFAVILAGALPHCENISGTQRALWTSHSFTRDQPTKDIQIDNGKVVNGVQSWRRTQFGFPFKSITLDHSLPPHYAIQARIETPLLVVNLAVGFIFGLFSGVAFILIKNGFKKGRKLGGV